MSRRRTIRCVIYTRKSSDEGLEQDFNSLDAQHAFASYVASQKHEGWRLVAQRYDDGGVSGGTLSGPPCSACWPTSMRAGSTWWGLQDRPA